MERPLGLEAPEFSSPLMSWGQTAQALLLQPCQRSVALPSAALPSPDHLLAGPGQGQGFKGTKARSHSLETDPWPPGPPFLPLVIPS